MRGRILCLMLCASFGMRLAPSAPSTLLRRFITRFPSSMGIIPASLALSREKYVREGRRSTRRPSSMGIIPASLALNREEVVLEDRRGRKGVCSVVRVIRPS